MALALLRWTHSGGGTVVRAAGPPSAIAGAAPIASASVVEAIQRSVAPRAGTDERDASMRA